MKLTFWGIEWGFRPFPRTLALVGLAIAVALLSTVARAVPPQVSTEYHYIECRRPNTVGFGYIPPCRQIFGAGDVLPNGDADGDGFADSDGPPVLPTTGSATQGITTRPLRFEPQTIFPNDFGRTDFIDPNLLGSWRLDFFNGPDTTTTFTPAISPGASTPFPEGVSMTPNGTTPTFDWVVPQGAAPENARVRIHDLEERPLGFADTIFDSGRLDPATMLYTMPSGVLEPNHEYALSVLLDDRRPDGTLESRSRTFHNFSTDPLPIPPGTPVFIPVVDPAGSPNGNPVLSFDVGVGAGEVLYFDPQVAVGYDYMIGAGDPNFASVIVPMVGDSMLGLYLFDALLGDYVLEAMLKAEMEFMFAAGGVDRFRILGIEGAAGLNPEDGTAFVTGLSFISAGQFTGTMTPIIASVPEPVTLALFTVGLAGVGLLGWRRKNAARAQSPQKLSPQKLSIATKSY